MPQTNRIAVLTVPTPVSWSIINAVVERFGPVHVIAEEREPRLQLIRKRMKRQGVLPVLGQAGFSLLEKLMARRSRRRIAEIVRDAGLDVAPNPACEIYKVDSVNSMACRAALAMIRPDVVLVIGTRIIGRETLAALNVPVINAHSGWNPTYRGQAGGYWALASGDPAHAGVTVHLVDHGVDTGGILARARFEATLQDNFHTCYYLQAAALRPLVVQAIADAKAGQLVPVTSDEPSRQNYLPTLWGYLWTGLRRGVW